MNGAADPKAAVSTAVTVVADRRQRLPDGADLDAWLAATLAAAGRAELPVQLGLRLADRDESRRLNRDYRGLDRPTNVLAFPAPGLPALCAEEAAVLGDLLICLPVLEAEAAEQGKPLLAHFAHIFVHGLLHLLGHVHDQVDDARRMEQLESRILERLGFADPWAAERSTGS